MATNPGFASGRLEGGHSVVRAAREFLFSQPPLLAGFGWGRVAWFLAFEMVLALFNWTVQALVTELPSRGLAENVAAYLSSLQRVTITYFPVLLLVSLADNIPVRGLARAVTLFAALVSGFAVAAAVHRIVPGDNTLLGNFGDLRSIVLGHLPHNFVQAGAIMILYFGWRRDHELADALRASQAAQAQSRRQRLESELQTMQARIEPGFLFATLSDARDLFERDPDAGDELLDHLSLYLRAALPPVRGAGSTLGQELSLVREWLAIQRMRTGNRLAFEADVAADLEAAHIAPMVLMPLANRVIGLDADAAPGTIAMRIEARAAHGRLAITIRGGTGIAPSTSAGDFRQVLDRLDALYGREASLRIQTTQSGERQALLEVPHEQPESGHR